MQRIILLLTLILFGALTAAAVWQDGIVGIFSSITRSAGSVQIFIDLVIACTLINVWIWRDAKAQGRNPWGWIIATFIIGTFSPLVYLLVRPSAQKQV
jgi:RsiW-degrading membrane proteinase PrsW (M82 family)